MNTIKYQTNFTHYAIAFTRDPTSPLVGGPRDDEENIWLIVSNNFERDLER